jgi:5-methyltetrahydrofolate--homocysteine methyltransferase
MRFEQAIQSKVIICDGAMGTELQKRGLSKGVTPDSWNITNPDQVKDVHKSYIQAGASAILTNTFGANSARIGKESKYTVRELNLAGAKIARECSGHDVLVFGDMGPTGWEDQLPPYGTLSEETFFEIFKEQAKALAESEIDAIIIETMSSLAEAVIALKAVRENTSLPIICSMTFARPPASRPDDLKTLWGDALPDIIETLTKEGANVLGSNCGDLFSEIPALAKTMRELTSLPLIFEVNAGLPRIDENYKTIYSLAPDVFAEIIMQAVDYGANIVGGCCGTNPEHISAIKNRLDKR